MGNVITSILTDSSARTTASVEQVLLDKAVARAWG